MFCKNCGKQISVGTGFCPFCGQAVSEAGKAALSTAGEAGKKNRAIGVGVVAVIVIVIIAAGFGGSVMQTGYKGIVKKYFKALENSDASIYYSIMSEDYLNDRMSGWGYTEQEIVSDYQEDLDSAMYEYIARCGDDIKISYDITDTYEPSEDEVAYLDMWLRDYGFASGSIEDAVVVYCEYTVKGSEGAVDYTTDRLILKVQGKWCITGGHFDLPWYDQ